MTVFNDAEEMSLSWMIYGYELGVQLQPDLENPASRMYEGYAKLITDTSRRIAFRGERARTRSGNAIIRDLELLRKEKPVE